MQRDVRLTLAVVFVKPTMDKLTVLTRLLRAVQMAGVTIKCLYADKAFCSIPVLRYLWYRHADPWETSRHAGVVSRTNQLPDHLHTPECRAGRLAGTSRSRADRAARTVGTSAGALA